MFTLHCCDAPGPTNRWRCYFFHFSGQCVRITHHQLHLKTQFCVWTGCVRHQVLFLTLSPVHTLNMWATGPFVKSLLLCPPCLCQTKTLWANIWSRTGDEHSLVGSMVTGSCLWSPAQFFNEAMEVPCRVTCTLWMKKSVKVFIC